MITLEFLLDLLQSSYNIYILYDSQLVHHTPSFNSFIIHNNSFDNPETEKNLNDIFLRFGILSFTETFFLLLLVRTKILRS